MPLADLRHLLGADEHPLDLGGLVGAAHPALDPHIAASAGTPAGQRSGKIAKRETNPWMMRIERGDGYFADLPFRYRIAGAGPHHLDDQILVDHHALARR